MKKPAMDKNGRYKPLNKKPKIEDVSLLLENWQQRLKDIEKEIQDEIKNRSGEVKAMFMQIEKDYPDAIKALIKQLVLEAEMWVYRGGIAGLDYGVGFDGNVSLQNYQSKYENWVSLINGPRCPYYWNHIIRSEERFNKN